VNEILGACALGLAIWYAHRRIASGLLAPDELVSFFTALILLYRPVKGLGQAQHTIQSGLAALDRIRGPACARPAPDDKWETRTTVPSIVLDGVTAGYGEGESVLRNLCLTLPMGERLAVIGPSGTGKSTLVNVLTGLLPVRDGRILVDGARLEAGPAAARAVFAPVPQEPFLFDDDIRMNVRCGRPTATDTEVASACAAAGVTDFAKRLPDGLASRVGRASLSVGERQRVCLARALVSKAPVILLDEMTASIDGETESAIVERLDSFLDGRSVLIVTHRRSTAARADRIALLEGGEISATGTPGDLLEGNPRIARLFGRAKNED
jgi:subfamily B ATP-binding cassette protein MsbA